MKFVTVRDLRTTPAQVWKDLPAEKEMVITNNGKPIALMTPITDSNLEESLKILRKARAIIAMQSIQKQASTRGLDSVSMEEIDAEIAAARKE